MSVTAHPLAAGAPPSPGTLPDSAYSPRALRQRHGGLPPQNAGVRYAGLVVVIGLHVAVLAALLLYQPAREMLGISKPVMVEFITPPAPPKPEPPKEQPKPKEVKIVKHVPQPKPQPEPPPVMTTTAPTPSPIVAAPPPPAPPPPPEPVAAAPAPPAPPAQPRVITGVEYVRKVEPVYPALSKRMNEQGKVGLRITIDTQGRPESVVVAKSSGSTRLDDAARKAYLDCLFKPYTENGVPQKAVASVTVNFSLSE